MIVRRGVLFFIVVRLFCLLFLHSIHHYFVWLAAEFARNSQPLVVISCRKSTYTITFVFVAIPFIIICFHLLLMSFIITTKLTLFH